MTENLINDLLDLAKMENSSFSLCTSYFDLSNIIVEALQMVSNSAKNNNINLSAVANNTRCLNYMQ